VSALEEFPIVSELFKKMSSMTLDGLRNVHSHDHQWSVSQGHGDGCSAFSAENCMVQASLSAPTYEFMEKHGFTENTESELKQEFNVYAQKLMLCAYPSWDWKISKSCRQKLWSYQEAAFFRLYSKDVVDTVFGEPKSDS